MKTVIIFIAYILLNYSNTVFAQRNNFDSQTSNLMITSNTKISEFNAEFLSESNLNSEEFNIDLKLDQDSPKEMKKGKLIAGAVICGSFNLAGIAMIAKGSSSIHKANNTPDWAIGLDNGVSGIFYVTWGTTAMAVGNSVGIPLIIRGKNPKQSKVKNL
ncbi:MAG: hypothetical protein R2728_11960 [Chitinophagales bacterium]